MAKYISILEEEYEFFLAAQEYAKLMLSDFRNARNAAEIQKRIDTARGKFYDSYRRMEDSQ